MKHLPLPVVKTVYSRSFFKGAYLLLSGSEPIALVRVTGARTATIPPEREAETYRTCTATVQGQEAVKMANKIARCFPFQSETRTAILRRMVWPYTK